MENLCHDFRKARKEYGEEVAKRLYMLINLLESVECLNSIYEMKNYHLHPLVGERKGQYALDLGRKIGYRLIIIPLDEEEKEWVIRDWNFICNATKIVLVWEVSNHYE